MATAFEHFDTGEGQSVGIFGHLSATRLFVVQTDNEDDAPEVVIQSGVGINSVPQGSGHPQNTGLIALQFTRGRRINDKAWFVIITYGPPVFFPSVSDQWDIRLTGHLDIEEPLHDLDGKQIAIPWYEPLSIPASPLGFVGRETGAQLKPTFPPKRFPVSRHVRGGTMVLSRSYGKFPKKPVSLIANAMNTVNNNRFAIRIKGSNSLLLLANRRQLLLTSWDIIATPGVAIGQEVVGQIWQATVTLNYSHVPWTPLQVRHRYEFEGLHEDVLGSDNKPVISDFRVYEESNFSALFT